MVTIEEVIVALNATVGYLGETGQLEKFVDSMAEHGNLSAYSVLKVSEYIEGLSNEEWDTIYSEATQSAMTSYDEREDELVSEDDK